MRKTVRARCGATGIDIGFNYCLFVSAQGNELCVDKIDFDREPQEGLPMPTKEEVSAAFEACCYFAPELQSLRGKMSKLETLAFGTQWRDTDPIGMRDELRRILRST